LSLAGADGENNVKMQILRSLREFYPIKVDEIVLISSVQKAQKDVTIDRVSQEIKELKSKGLIEESVIKAPFGKTETYRYKITSDGIDYLQSLEERGAKREGVSAREIETRLIETYDRIQSDMEEMKQGIESSQKSLDAEMKEMRQRIMDHDQVIRTYFLRVIETFGVFVSIFAIVVVLILTIGLSLQHDAGMEDYWVIIMSVPLSIMVYVLVMIWGIKRFILVDPCKEDGKRER
jgi:DNA-binding transcriptional ArsR family regulator